MALTTGIGNNYVLAVNLLCVMYQTAVLEFYFENLLVQSYNAPNAVQDDSEAPSGCLYFIP